MRSRAARINSSVSCDTSFSALRLHELEREAVGLTDRRVLGFALLTHGVIRRQRPHALRVILRVFRIGVDLGLADELETHRLDQLDRPVLTDVRLPALLRLIARIVVPMLLDAED